MTKNIKLGQVSVDFLIVLAIALIIFLAIFAISEKRNDILDSQRTKLYAKQEVDKLASTINAVFLAGHGTNKTISLPATLKDETPYNISIHPSAHIVNINYDFDDTLRHYTTTIITANVSGNLDGLKNTIKVINLNEGIIIE